MRPASRKGSLLAHAVGDELVIYDERSYAAHRLSPTAAIVWRLADGERSVPQLASALRRELARSAAARDSAALAQDTSEELVRMALRELDRVGLLTARLPALGEPLSRREMIGVTAALVPAIASILAPSPAMAQTIPGLFNPALFNGTYAGKGSPGTPNLCGLGSSDVFLVITFPPFLFSGTMTITHGSAPGQGTVFASQVSVTATTATAIGVIGSGSTGPRGFQTSDQFTFTLMGATASVTGTQQITYPECGTTPYNITATRQ